METSRMDVGTNIVDNNTRTMWNPRGIQQDSEDQSRTVLPRDTLLTPPSSLAPGNFQTPPLLPAPVEFQVVQGEVLSSTSCDYLVQVFRGEGCFGKVAQCLKMDTATTVAVKVLRKGADALQDFKRERAMLEAVSILDADKCHLVQWHECFLHRGHPCLVFQMLDKSLQAFMEERNQPLSLIEIRPVLKQLAQAFAGLKSIGLIHADLKPDNIMLVNCVDQPYRVKLIDFGLATPASTVRPGDIFHALWYRAPEVLLGLPATEAIDMWALGCIMAYMFLGHHLYISNNEYDAIRFIVEAQGLPENHLLDAGVYTNWFFRRDLDVWRLKTPEEFTCETGIKSIERRTHIFDRLSELMHLYPNEAVECQDVWAFVGLMEWMMEVDAEQRATPGDALQHPFLTMSHLEDSYATSSHVQASFLAMKAFSHGSTSATTESVTIVPVDKASTTSVPVDETSITTVLVDKASTTSVPVDKTTTTTTMTTTTDPVDKASTSSVPVDMTSITTVLVDKASTTSVPVDMTSITTVLVDKASTTSVPVDKTTATTTMTTASDPTDGASTPSDPADGASTPADPADGASTPSDPTDGASTPSDPADGASTPSDPADGASTPADPADGASTPSVPTDGASTPSDSAAEASTAIPTEVKKKKFRPVKKMRRFLSRLRKALHCCFPHAEE